MIAQVLDRNKTTLKLPHNYRRCGDCTSLLFGGHELYTGRKDESRCYEANGVNRARLSPFVSLDPSPCFFFCFLPHRLMHTDHINVLCPQVSSRIKLIARHGCEKCIYPFGSQPASSLHTGCVSWQKVIIPVKATLSDTLFFQILKTSLPLSIWA